MKFFNKYFLYIAFGLISFGAFIFAGILAIPDTSVENIITYLNNDPEGKKLYLSFWVSVGELFFIIVVVKVFLTQRTFLEAIYEHFKKIFIEKDVVNLYDASQLEDLSKKVYSAEKSLKVKHEDLKKGLTDSILENFKKIFIGTDFIKHYSQNELRKIAEEVNKAHDGLTLEYNELKNESIKLLEKEWELGKQDLNYIVTESEYVDTIYEDEYEIKHKKFSFKIMKKGDFNYLYYFIPFDKVINPDDFDHKNYNRWNKKNFKLKAKRINGSNQPVEITPVFSVDVEDGKKWILITMEHTPKSYSKLKKDDEFMIEMSLSQKIKLDNSPESQQRRMEYYHSNYDTPNAIRSVKFQIETYNEKKLNFIPVIHIGEEIERAEPTEGIYYKTWSWKFFHSEVKEKEISIHIEN